jgi:hypothetical protein
MESKSLWQKLIDAVAANSRLFFTISCVTVLAVVVTAAVAVGASRDIKLDSDPDDIIDEKGYELEEFPLPDEFDELNKLIDPPVETGGENAENGENGENSENGENGEETPPPLPPLDSIITGLPAVYINTNSGGGITSRTTYINATFSVTAPDGSEFGSFGRTSVRVRGRGNSTWEASKKPYRLNFDSRVSFLGLPEGRNYVLLANAYDQSHIRNSVAFAAARTLSFNFVPTAVHVDLYVNNVYQGLYTIGDSIRVSSDQIGIERDGGFLVELGGVKRNVHKLGTDFFHSHVQSNIRIRYPAPGTSLTRPQFNEIRDYFLKACDSVRKPANYEDYFDMVSLIDYFLITELLYNYDGSFARSVFISKNPGEKLRLASVWDFDLAMGNYSVDRSRYTSWACVHTEDGWFSQPTWINYLIEDPAFQFAVRQRWEQVGNNLYNAARNEIARNRALLDNAVLKNNRVAPFETSRFTSWQTEAITTWAGQLDYINTFITLRRNWMNEQISRFPSSPPDGRNVLTTTTTTTTTTTPRTAPPTPRPTTTTTTTPAAPPPIIPTGGDNGEEDEGDNGDG